MKSTSVAKCVTNRVHGPKSTGPVTEAGKARMRNNALRHGLTSRHAVIESENPEAYEALRQDLVSDWKPADFEEEMLATQIAEGALRLMRARLIDTQILESHMAEAGDDPDCWIAESFHANGKQFHNPRRDETAIERADLPRATNERRKRAIGFVSQKAMRPSVHSVFSVLKISPKNGLTQ